MKKTCQKDQVQTQIYGVYKHPFELRDGLKPV